MERLQSAWQWIREHLLAVIGVTLLVLGFGSAVGGSLYDGNTLREAIEAFYANAGTELISIAITVLVIDTITHLRNREDEKRRLILQMGSDNNAFAKEAVRILALEGWVKNGTLRGAHLLKANLQNAELWRADLRGAELKDADLQGAGLSGANLQWAHLDDANLQGAILGQANLQHAIMNSTNLRWADLRIADLRGAVMMNADLQGALLDIANLRGAALLGANLQGAHLHSADLRGAGFLTIEQLTQVESLKASTLPDGYMLPSDDTWRDAFEKWCETVETEESLLGLDCIKPAEIDDDGENRHR